MKVKSYTFHYWRDGKRKSKTYKVDNKNIRHDQDAKSLFYKDHDIKDVIYLTADY